MKRYLLSFFLSSFFWISATAQTPYQKIDSICKRINQLEKTSEKHVFVDVSKQEYLLSVPETSFQVFVNNRLATKVASGETNGKQYLELTEGIDLSQAQSFSGVMAGKDLVEVRLHFPKQSLTVQVYEDGEYKKSLKTDYLGFLVSSKTSKGAQNVYSMIHLVSSLSSMFIKEKGLVDKIGKQWGNYSMERLEVFLEYQRTNPRRVAVMDSLSRAYKYKTGLSEYGFKAHNIQAAAIMKKNNLLTSTRYARWKDYQSPGPVEVLLNPAGHVTGLEHIIQENSYTADKCQSEYRRRMQFIRRHFDPDFLREKKEANGDLSVTIVNLAVSYSITFKFVQRYKGCVESIRFSERAE